MPNEKDSLMDSPINQKRSGPLLAALIVVAVLVAVAMLAARAAADNALPSASVGENNGRPCLVNPFSLDEATTLLDPAAPCLISAIDTATVSTAAVQLVPVNPSICNTGTVNINISNVANLYGYQFKVNYNGTLLSADASFVNTWFDPASHGFTGPPDWQASCNDATGVCQFAHTRGYPDGPLSGSGVVAQIQFTSNLPPAATNTAVSVSDLILSDLDGYPITPVSLGSANLSLCGPTVSNLCPASHPQVGNRRTDMLGIGQNNRTRKLNVPNSDSVVSLYGQLAALDSGIMKYVRFMHPNGTKVEIQNPTSPAYRPFAVNWWGSNLTPNKFIKGQFFWGKKGNDSPRAFVLWPTYQTSTAYANVFTTFNQSINNHVYHAVSGGWVATVTQTMAIPETQGPGADVLVKVALVDNDRDGRPVILTVTAGGVTQVLVDYIPDSGDMLNLETILLENVAAGTDEVVITLHSPPVSSLYPAGGDSVAMIGAAASYVCNPSAASR